MARQGFTSQANGGILTPDRECRMAGRRWARKGLIGLACAGLAVAGHAAASQSVLPRFDENVYARALRQVREQRGPSSELRFTQVGEARVLCGYTGRRGQSEAVAFVSRPSRILFSDDPLQVEFREARDRFCPDLPRTPVTTPR